MLSLSRHVACWLLSVALPVCAVLAADGTSEQDGGWLGVTLGRGDDVVASDGPRLGGVEVVGIVKHSPAERAGLRARDRIVAIDGEAVTSPGRLIRRVGALTPGRWVALTVEREGTERELTARLASRPEDEREIELVRGWIGIESIDLPPSLRVHFGADEDSGVMVASVDPLSPAEVAGLAPGDVVFRVDGRPVPSTGQLQARVVGAGVGNRLELTVMRDGSEIVLEATVAEAPPTGPE